MTDMKSIYFQPPFADKMVLAILEGRKTVTRRVVKEPWYIEDAEVSRVSGFVMHRGINSTHGMPYPDQLYRPGDILYVRETWCKTDCFGLQNGYVYKANDNSIFDNTGFTPKWRPSIHMPCEAARIFLRVTDVRVERLQNMKMGDIQAEGVVPDTVEGGQFEQWQREYMRPVWDSAIKKADRALYGWEANPYVWVIEFERCGKPEEGAT